MLILYPSHFLNPKLVDDDYASQAAATRDLHIPYQLLDQAALEDKNYTRAVRNITPPATSPGDPPTDPSSHPADGTA